MGVKISELSELTSIDGDDRLIINHNGATYQGNLDTILGNYSFNYISEGDLFGNHGYLNGYVTKDELSGGHGYVLEDYVTKDYLSNYTPQIDLSGYLNENRSIVTSYLNENYYITESYLNENNYITESYLNNHGYLTESYLNENYYITENYLSGYVTSNDLEGYVTSNDLSNYVTLDNLSGYLFNGNGYNGSGYLREIYNSDGTVNFEAIYNGISSYFET